VQGFEGNAAADEHLVRTLLDGTRPADPIGGRPSGVESQVNHALDRFSATPRCLPPNGSQ